MYYLYLHVSGVLSCHVCIYMLPHPPHTCSPVIQRIPVDVTWQQVYSQFIQRATIVLYAKPVILHPLVGLVVTNLTRGCSITYTYYCLQLADVSAA